MLRSSRSLLHHSTSNTIDLNAKHGYYAKLQKISKGIFNTSLEVENMKTFYKTKTFHSISDSTLILRSLRKSQNNNNENSFLPNIITYFRCFYLTFVLVFLLLAYNQYLNLRQKHRIHENVGKEDEIDSKKISIYKINEVVSDVEVSLKLIRTLKFFSIKKFFLQNRYQCIDYCH